MITCSLDALKKSEKERNENKKRNLVEVLQQPSYCKKRTENEKIEMMKFVALTLHLLTRITLQLTLSSAIIGCF